MTKREFLEAVKNSGNVELANYAAEELVKMDEASAKRKEKPTKAQLANVELAEALYAAMSTQTYTATEIAALGVEGITSTPKATAVLKVLVADGRVIAGEGRAKNSIVKTYTKA